MPRQARYTTGKTKAFFYIAVMLPMWASYIVKAYAWTLILAQGGVVLDTLGIPGARAKEFLLTEDEMYREHLIKRVTMGVVERHRSRREFA